MPLRFEPGVAETYHFPLTIRHLLDNSVASAGENVIVSGDLRLSYPQFIERVGRLASLLTDCGVEQGQTVAVMDWDSHRYLESYFAIPMMGAVLQMVNVRLAPAQIAYTIEHAGADLILVHEDFREIFDAIRPTITRPLKVIKLTESSVAEQQPGDVGEYEAMLASSDPNFLFEDFDENAVATTFYTTGTTGDPKGVCYTHRQLVLHALALKGARGSGEGPGLGQSDVYMPLTPMFHVHAWGFPYVATMLGVTQVYPGRYLPDRIVALQQREGVTFSHCVPTILEMILQAAHASGISCRNWSMIIGGSALTEDLHERAAACGISTSTGYGMSETGPIVSLSAPGPDGKEASATGRPIPLVSVRVVNDAMEDVPPDGVSLGELVIRAPWLTPCYVGNDEAGGALWNGGWLHTEDIATIDATGNLRIRDRKKDVIKSGGEWICSLTLENIVQESPKVAAAAIVAVPHPKWQERPLAVVVPEPGMEPRLEDLNALIGAAVKAGKVGRFALLDEMRLVDALPLTSVGKVDKKMLRAGLGAV